MKNSIRAIALSLFSVLHVFAQNMTPSVDYLGHIVHENIEVGFLNSNGGYDKIGKKICQADEEGNVTDLEGGFIAKGPEGNIFTFTHLGVSEKYNISLVTQVGMLEVNNSLGKTVLLLHKDFKVQAVCAMHFLYNNHAMLGQK